MFNSLFSPLLLLVAVVVVWITLIIYWTFVIYGHAAWEHLLCLVKTLMHGIKWLISLFYYLSLACFEQVLCRHSDPSFHLNIDACCCSHKIRASVILVSCTKRLQILPILNYDMQQYVLREHLHDYHESRTPDTDMNQNDK